MSDSADAYHWSGSESWRRITADLPRIKSSSRDRLIHFIGEDVQQQIETLVWIWLDQVLLGTAC